MLFVITLFLSQLGEEPSNINDFWLNLAASFLLVLITIFVLDAFQKSAEAASWEEVSQSVNEDIRFQTHAAISYIAGVFGISILNDKNEIDKDIGQIIHDLQDVDTLSMLKKLDVKEWNQLANKLEYVKAKITENLSLYGRWMPSSYLAKTFKVRRSIASFQHFLDLSPELFLKSTKDWSEEIESGIGVRDIIMRPLSNELHDYFGAVGELYELIDKRH